MGKTQEIPSRAVAKKKAVTKAKKSKVQLTPEQSARLAAFREFVKFQDEQWANMSPKEQREAERKWELFKRSMNDDRAGYRQVFVDD